MPGEATRTHPLTTSQQVFWALAEMLPDSSVGNEALILRMRGPLQRAALLDGIAALAERYAAWRTTISLDANDLSGRPLAREQLLAPFPVESVELSELPAGERATRLDALIRERLEARIDLSRGAQMRVSLFRCAADEHVLLFVSQHAAFDGISFFDVLPRTLAACYSARMRGEPIALPPTVSFAQFARAQSAILDDAERPALGYWRETLTGATAALELPVERRRGHARACRGLRTSTTLDSARRDRLTSRARELGVSLSDILLAAFAALLHRYSAQNDLMIGVPHGNRTAPGTEELFGCAMLTLPVRCDLSGEPSVAELARRVRMSKRAAFDHLDPGIDEIVRERVTHGEREGGSGYRAVFSFARYSFRNLPFEGLEVEAERPDPGWTAVDISIDVSEDSVGLNCTLEVDRDLFDDASARRTLGHYLNVLDDIASRGDVAVRSLVLLGAEERDQTVRDASASSLPFPHDRCLHEVLSELAPSQLGALAAVCRGRELSYTDLQVNARRLGAHLRGLGARPGERVAVLVDEPLLGLVGMLGALHSGAAFVPIDTSAPSARITSIIESCIPIAIVTQTSLVSALPGDRIAHVCLDALSADLPIGEMESGALRPSADDPAYVIFTSGSTGEPKGVVVSHRNIVSQLFARLHGYRDRPQRTLTAHSFAFDASLAGVFWTLASGGLLVLPDSDQRRDPLALRRLVSLHRVTHLDIPPVLHQEMLEGAGNDDLTSLDAVIVGGEVCTASLARRHYEVLPGAQLYNEYGPTETTIYSTVYAVPRGEIDGGIPIGRPIANARCYILDENMELLPRGSSGELFIGGPGVALGYLNQSGMTSKRFLPDRFAGVPDARMYRTGDRVRLRGDGELEFLGRVDRQVKVRGNRVELGGIEAKLLATPGVQSAVAALRRDAGGSHVIAWVVLDPAAPPSPKALRARLREELPEYMVPTQGCPIASLPLTPAGKVDLDRLPTPNRDADADDGRVVGYLDPRTQAEFRISEIWVELLGQPRVGAHDDFFDLGGHSLLAVRMLGVVAATLGVRIPLAAFARTPTVAGLANMLHHEGGVREEPLVVEIQPHGARSPLWVIHPVGGHVLFMKRLVRHLPSDLPLYGIQAQGLDGHREPLQTVEEMARLYMQLIRQVQPVGPYYIGGHSMGGLVALELAQHLHAAREEVGMAAVIDAPGPGYPRYLPLPLRVLDRVRFLARAKWRSRATKDGLTEYLSYVPFGPEPARDHLTDAVSRVALANSHAADIYQPRFYPGRIHLFRAMRTPDWPGIRFDDPLSGWGPYAREVKVVPIDSGHVEMLDEPTLTELGKRLSASLDDVMQPSSRRTA
jgi:amino acid adenylation domain-containing protein